MTERPDQAADLPDDPQQRRIAELLRTAPSPGPMPAALSDRITDALAQEQTAREQGDHTDADGTVTTLGPRPTGRRAARTGSGASATGSAPTSAGRSGNGWWRPVAGLAAAAAVGAVATLGYQQLRPGSDPSMAGPSATQVQPTDIADGVHVAHTGTSYTSGDLAAQAADLTQSADRHPITQDEVRKIGVIATSEGALQCAQSIASELSKRPDKVTIDIAELNRTPAMIVVLTKDGRSTVWALSQSCDARSKPMAGPAKVDS